MPDLAVRAWRPVAAWAAFQLALTSVPGEALPAGIFHPLDLLAHFGLYAVLGVLLARAAGLAAWPASRRWKLWAGVVVVAALDEAHQLFIPGRDASSLDWGCDALGVTAGLGLGMRLMASRVAGWLR